MRLDRIGALVLPLVISVPVWAATYPVVPTAPAGDNSNAVANTRFVRGAISTTTGVDVRAAPYNAVCDGVTNVAPAVDAAVAAGARSILLGANCLYLPDSDGTTSTPDDVEIVGANPITSILSTATPTVNNVRIGARGVLQNVNIVGLFCYNGAGAANATRICPLLGRMVNNNDTNQIAQNYPGSGDVYFGGAPTYGGVTTSTGNGPQGLVTFCTNEDCIYTENDSTNSTALRTVTTVDAGAFQQFQYSTDTFGLHDKCAKARGTQGTPIVVVAADILCDYQFFGHDGTNFVLAGEIELQAVGSITTAQVPGNMVFRVANSGGTITNGMSINGNVSKLEVGLSQTPFLDFNNNATFASMTSGTPTGGGEGAGTVNAAGAYYANGTIGVSCGAGTVSLTTLVVTNGIVTHC